MYEAQLPADWTYILNDSGAKMVVCATQDIYDTVMKQVKPSVPGLQDVLCLNASKAEPHSFGCALDSVSPDAEGRLVRAPAPDDLANLIYTSGTTGKPKGVELTHLNFASNVKAAARTMVTDPHDFVRFNDRSLAFLPWAHSYGQTCELWMFMSHGASMGVCRGVPMILEDLQLVKPTVLFAVPTLYKKIYDGVHNLMVAAPPLRRKLMERALHLGNRSVQAGLRHEPPLGLLERLQFRVLDRIVLGKIRDRFGGNLRHGFVAGAACPAEVLSFMDSIGIPVCEGYGLTETSPIITINTPEQRLVGSVGRPIGGVTVYIVDEDGKEVPVGDEGEVCCVGPNVMRGYYNNPEATAEVITAAPDGRGRMFHTGDLGRRDAEGFVRITGRLKEQYKLENGKYVVPTPIEEAIGMSRFIAQVVLCGANRPYNVALLVPEWSAIRAELKVGDSVAEEELVNDERVRSLIDKEIEKTCAKLKKYEVPQEWAFVAPFTAANNMLTPKMSIRRHKVIQTYGDVISHMYGDDPVVSEAADATGAKEHADHAHSQAAA
jgi:long-chain acyl-CoA synthetase